MPKVATCPSCGAPVTFQAAASILAVCEYCQSTLVRDGDVLENLGKMAALLDDRSPLQRGAEGAFDKRRFGLIGRLQLRYAQGLWSEWHLLYDDGTSGWLSEAGGEYVLSAPVWINETLPRFTDLAVGQTQLIDGRSWRVTNILEAECVAGEGELPFRVGAGYPAPVVDLRNEKGGFLTLDYSDDAEKRERPLVFIGKPVAFNAIDWRNLKEGTPLPQANVKARAFACPSCGAALTVDLDDTRTVGCKACGSAIDASNETARLIAKAKEKLRVRPTLALGSKGEIRGESLEVIGFQERYMKYDKVKYFWREYVLLAKDRSLRWLTEYDGHWNIGRVQDKAMQVSGQKVQYDSTEFKHFQTYQGTTSYVIGEFPWQVRLNESARCIDYVAPPRSLACELSTDEESWTLLEYLPKEELAAGFKLATALPRTRGVFANEPNPWDKPHRTMCRTFWFSVLLALLIEIGLGAMHPGDVLHETLTFRADDDEPVVSREFRLPAGAQRLEVVQNTNLSNNWLGVGMTLVNKDTGESWSVSREISRYEGVDDGESWSEGSREDEIVFTELPAGTYFLAQEGEMDAAAAPNGVSSELAIRVPGPRWSSFFVFLFCMLPFPIFSRWRKGSFEIRRWAESDHPIVTVSDDDDSSDDD